MNPLQRRIDELVQQHGSFRTAGLALGVDHAYLWRLMKGGKENASDALLDKLGVHRAEATYVVTEPAVPQPALPELRPIPGFPNYSVSSDGAVYSTAMARLRPVAAHLDAQGYWTVHPMVDGRRRKLLNHRAVLLAWRGQPPDGKPWGCHNNGIPTDNRIDNLRWDDIYGNWADKLRHGTHSIGARSNLAKLTQAQVDEIRARFNSRTGRFWGASTLALKFGVSQSRVSEVAHGKNGTWREVAR